MESVFTCLGLIALLALLIPFALVFAHARKIKTLEQALQKLAGRTAQLEAQLRGQTPAPSTPTAVEPTPPTPVRVAPPPVTVSPAMASILKTSEASPPPITTPPSPKPSPAAKARAPIDWESFLGVKLFAWIGGFVLFLGVVFLVKYSFENNLVTPAMRVVLGAIIGALLIAAGWFAARRDFRVPGQSLCATGVVILYADIFGAHAFYALISLGAAFALMSLVTVGAFFLAVRLHAQVVVILGMLGGFLTPPLLDHQSDQPLRLFTYIALLNAGVAAVVLRKRWDYLLLLGAIGTVLTQVGWLDHFHTSRATAGFLIFLGFQAQFLLFVWLRGKLEPKDKWSTAAAALMGGIAMAFGFFLLFFNELALRPGYFFGFVFLADVGLLALAVMQLNPARIAAPAGTLVFVLLATWTAGYLWDGLLWWTLGAYCLFALLHAGFSVWPARPETKGAISRWQSYVPLLALGLLFICVWRGEASFAVWGCLLLVNLLALWVAWAVRSMAILVIALVATVITAGLWILTAPPVNESVMGILFVIGGFGLFFSGASIFLTGRLGSSRRNIPTVAAAMPFLLLLMLVAKLPIGAPTAVFAAALLLAVILLGLGIYARTSWIGLVALIFTWLVESEWHMLHLASNYSAIAFGWYFAFFLLFVAYPYFCSEEKGQVPWAMGALSGLLHFWLIYDLVSLSYPAWRNGLLPAFFIVPFAFGVWYLIKRRQILPATGDARLAWQGGAALFFLSLIFPIQFEREWITLGWALEGFALLLLFRIVPNAGLRLVGTGLLSLAFIRLALNPAVLEYHRRAPVRIWNWYLYAYGLTSLCLFGGAQLTRAYRDTLLARVVPRSLYTLGAILTFLLLNIEIADYFSVGPTLTFSFSGNFARDMTYSIAWALFAFVLLIIGMKRRLRYVRYAALALLLITLIKLFLHDLGNLSQLYRIGALIGVALILIVASFVYQRFLAPKSVSPP